MRKSGEERKAEIVQRALELAAERGAARVTTQAIADRVGIAQPTIFRHFKSRDAIFRAALEWVAGSLFKVLEANFFGDAPADERLRTLLARQLSFVSRQKGVPRLLFSDRLHLEDPELKQTVRRIMDGFTGRLAVLLEEGVEEGRFDAAIDPEETARMIVALIQGSIMRWSIFDFSYPLADQAEAIWRVVWPAIRAK